MIFLFLSGEPDSLTGELYYGGVFSSLITDPLPAAV
jgi:hypothetical protein